MSEYDPAEAVENLKNGGRIGREELNLIRNRLRAPSPGDDIYNLVRALALGTRPSDEDIGLVEKFLTPETEDRDLKGVIYALCDYWGLADRYLDQLFSFAHFEKWGTYPSAAIAAFGALGDHANKTKEGHIFARLLEIFDARMQARKPGSSGSREDQYLGLVYQALDVGVRGRAALLDHIKDVKIPGGIDQNIVSQARKYARKH